MKRYNCLFVRKEKYGICVLCPRDVLSLQLFDGWRETFV